jgi:hypothetical protein
MVGVGVINGVRGRGVGGCKGGLPPVPLVSVRLRALSKHSLLGLVPLERGEALKCQ